MELMVLTQLVEIHLEIPWKSPWKSLRIYKFVGNLLEIPWKSLGNLLEPPNTSWVPRRKPFRSGHPPVPRRHWRALGGFLARSGHGFVGQCAWAAREASDEGREWEAPWWGVFPSRSLL